MHFAAAILISYVNTLHLTSKKTHSVLVIATRDEQASFSNVATIESHLLYLADGIEHLLKEMEQEVLQESQWIECICVSSFHNR